MSQLCAAHVKQQNSPITMSWICATQVSNCGRLVLFLYHDYVLHISSSSIARSEPDGTGWRTGGEVKGKHASGALHSTSDHGVSSIATITTTDAHTSVASSWLNWPPRQFKWTRPFRCTTKSGFCACAITFRTCYTMVLFLCHDYVLHMSKSSIMVLFLYHDYVLHMYQTLVEWQCSVSYCNFFQLMA